MNWSIYKTSQTLIEGSEAWVLSQKYPHAVSHDDTNTVFVESISDTSNSFILPDLDNDDEMALVAAQWLYSESEKGLVLTQGQAERLFTHPAHRLWCAKYEDASSTLSQFKDDYNYVGSFLETFYPSIAWPPFTEDLTPAQARAIMLQGLGG